MVFLPLNSRVPIVDGDTILETALKNGLPLQHSCGGMGSCTTCRVIVVQGLEKMGPRSELETEHAVARGFRPEERLGCQNKANDDLTVLIPEPEDV